MAAREMVCKFVIKPLWMNKRGTTINKITRYFITNGFALDVQQSASHWGQPLATRRAIKSTKCTRAGSSMAPAGNKLSYAAGASTEFCVGWRSTQKKMYMYLKQLDSYRRLQ